MSKSKYLLFLNLVSDKKTSNTSEPSKTETTNDLPLYLRFVNYLMSDIPPGPKFIKMNWYINL